MEYKSHDCMAQAKSPIKIILSSIGYHSFKGILRKCYRCITTSDKKNYTILHEGMILLSYQMMLVL